MKRKMAALLIGNAKYLAGNSLANPTNDAADLGDKLKSYGFDLIVATDCSAKQMEQSLKDFRGMLENNDVGLFFFAGHGVQIGGSNYLLAVDSDMASEIDAKHSSLSLDKVVDVMANSSSSTKIIILDACRNNPWERAWHRGLESRGLASVYAPKGTIIGFATSPGEVAYDGSGRNGTYTAALLQHIELQDCSIETMFKRVRNTVAASSSGKQTTWEHTSLSGEFYFNLGLGNAIPEYDGRSLADGLFETDDAIGAHEIVAQLRSSSWYSQNPAISKVTAELANSSTSDDMFVIGRNVYQAACGRSGAAVDFIAKFMQKTRQFDSDKRKALLDGMLFEIYVGPNGGLRKRAKNDFLDEVFELQRQSTLKDSFDFIATALVALGGDYYAVPGKGQILSVTISIKQVGEEQRVDAVYIGGQNVLRAESAHVDGGKYSRIEFGRLSSLIAEDLYLPSSNLTITCTPAEHAGELFIPSGWTVRKGKP